MAAPTAMTSPAALPWRAAPLVAPALAAPAPLAAARLADADSVTVTVSAPDSAPDDGCRVMVTRTPDEAVSTTVAVTAAREEEVSELETTEEEEDEDAVAASGVRRHLAVSPAPGGAVSE